jgi:FKBP-type peptidyl-prolyl cis-trans isomerase SlyD
MRPVAMPPVPAEVQMQVAQDTVVLIHYSLRNDAGEVLDSSSGGDPLAYLHGNGNLVPGLERALEGRVTGDKLSVTVPPGEGYGEHDPALVQNVPRAAFRGIEDVRVGMRFEAQSNHGPRVVIVTGVAGDDVTVDGNHPLAGQSLSFEVEVTDVRAATSEELDHGHVHGPGDHNHG